MAGKYFLHIKSWEEGTEELNLEQEAFYLRLINLMYRYDGALPDNDQLLHFKTRTSMRMFRRLKKELLDREKIFEENGLLMNIKVNLELEQINLKSIKNATAAKLKHNKYKTKLANSKAKSLKNNDNGSANAQRTLCIDPCETPAIQGNRGTGDKEKNIQKDFDEFWNTCLRKEAKSQSFINYKKARKESSKEIIHKSMIAYSHKCVTENTETRYIKKPNNWLTAEMYLDQLESSAEQINHTDKGWQVVVKKYQQTGKWYDEWGPQPDMPGTRVPQPILNENGFNPTTEAGK